MHLAQPSGRGCDAPGPLADERTRRPYTSTVEAIRIIRALLRGEPVPGSEQFTVSTQAHLDFEPLRRDLPVYAGAVNERMLRAAGEHSAQDLLPSVRVPTLVVAGSKDTFTPPEVSVAMAESIPGARLALIPGGSHILPLEERDRLREELRDFLGSL